MIRSFHSLLKNQKHLHNLNKCFPFVVPRKAVLPLDLQLFKPSEAHQFRSIHSNATCDSPREGAIESSSGDTAAKTKKDNASLKQLPRVYRNPLRKNLWKGVAQWLARWSGNVRVPYHPFNNNLEGPSWRGGPAIRHTRNNVSPLSALRNVCAGWGFLLFFEWRPPVPLPLPPRITAPRNFSGATDTTTFLQQRKTVINWWDTYCLLFMGDCRKNFMSEEAQIRKLLACIYIDDMLLTAPNFWSTMIRWATNRRLFIIVL